MWTSWPITMMEFEVWVSDNYDALVTIARQQTRGGQDAVDLLHRLVELVIDNGLSRLNPSYTFEVWFALELKHDFWNETTVRENASRNLDKVAGWISVLGEADTFADTKRAAVNKAKQRMRDKAKGIQPMGCELEEAASRMFEGRSEGNTRWRYQQLRDGRLFYERAVRSLAESMHRASQRQRHFSQAGVSLLDWGVEDISTSRPDDRAVGIRILSERRSA